MVLIEFGILAMMKSLGVKEKRVNQFFQLSSREVRYHALRKTIWVFSQLHDFIGVGSIFPTDCK
jgi:hypothetical protein